MRIPLFNKEDFFLAACCFEASLILVALLLGWITGIDPFATLRFSTPALAYGILGSLPLFLMFLGLHRLQNTAIADIRKFLLNTLGPHLLRYRWPHLLMLSSIAGVSEELLFRGVLQPWLESVGGMAIGLLTSNLLFGLVHAVTPLYALLAGLVGVYLGWSLDIAGERNLLVPIVIHSLYDFLAFAALLRAYRAGLPATTA